MFNNNIKEKNIIVHEELPKNLDKQWKILSKNLLINIKENPILRKELLLWNKNNISEKLVSDFVNSELSFNYKVKILINSYKEELINILGFKSIENSNIGTDVKNSLLTENEKEILLNRYSYSRDIKMLLLTSELLDNKIDLSGQEHIELKSGINITNNLDESNDLNILFDIKNWKGRKKIKDRVYEVSIGDKKYILKEKKTKFHKDTILNGHIDGINSLEEFNLAKKFNNFQKNNNGIFKVTYEKPISTVSFPDGYQFTIFKFNDILEQEKVDINTLANMIFKNREQFYDNYLDVYYIYKKYLDDEKIIYQSSFYDNKGFLSKIKKIFVGKNKFSYKDYSYIKANYLLGKESLVYENNILEGGYYNDDGYQYNTRINKKNNGEIELEMFIYDFEYFLKVKKHDIKIMLLENIEKFKKCNFYIYRNYGKLNGTHRDAFAASYVLQELDDLK